jgi:hypothetical protein
VRKLEHNGFGGREVDPIKDQKDKVRKILRKRGYRDPIKFY